MRKISLKWYIYVYLYPGLGSLSPGEKSTLNSNFQSKFYILLGEFDQNFAARRVFILAFLHILVGIARIYIQPDIRLAEPSNGSGQVTKALNTPPHSSLVATFFGGIFLEPRKRLFFS